MAEHKALIGIGQDNRHPDRVRLPEGNDENLKQVKNGNPGRVQSAAKSILTAHSDIGLNW